MRGETSGLYVVTGRRIYRGHSPGEEFEARLDPAAEQRAINRRDIRLIKRITPRVQPGSFQLPHGWSDPPGTRPNAAHTEAPTGASFVGGSE